MRDILTALLLLTGCFFALVSAIGVLRLPDLYMRMHASSKAGTMGAGFIMVAMAVHFGDTVITGKVLLIIGFIVTTAPIAAHVIARAAYRTGEPLWNKSVIDDLKCSKDTTPPIAQRKIRITKGRPETNKGKNQ